VKVAIAVHRRSRSTTEAPRAARRPKASLPPLIRACVATFAVLALAALFAPYVAPYDPTSQTLMARNLPPAFLPGGSDAYLLGTDQLGRDVLSRIVFGLRVSLGIAAIGTLIGLALGTVLGLASGLVGGWLDHLVMMLIDVQIAVPFILIALTAVAVFGSSLTVLVVVVGIAGWETYARLVRGQVLATRGLPFVEASRALGASSVRVALHHVLPNVASPIIVLATLNFSSIVLLESALSFLGIGVQPPTASLGSMVGAGRDYMASAWWIVAVPSFFVFLLTLVVSLLGDWLRDVLDVRLTT
jgi:peptide/nickel transport system permease protein